MSASNKKKLRKQEAEAQMTNRQKSASQEMKQQKRLTRTFWIVIVLCVCITAGTLLASPVKNVFYRNTDAVEVGGHTLNAVEVNYYYVDAINTFYSNYQNYISYFMSTTTPLDEQVSDPTTGETWADYFVKQAYNNIKSTYAVYNEAMAKGFTLDETQKASIDNSVAYMELYASIYGFKDVDAYLQDMYGPGADTESYLEYYEKIVIAEAYYAKYSEDLDYTMEQRNEYQLDKAHQFTSYTYASYYLAVSRFYPEGAGTKGEDGKMTYTAEETAAAVAAAKAAAEALAAGKYETLEDFDKAINELDVNKTTTTDKNETDKNETDKTEKTTEGEENTEGGENTENGENTEGGESTEGGENTEGGESTEGGETDKEEDKKPVLKYKSDKKEKILYSSVNSLFRDWISGYFPAEEEDGEPTIEVRQEGDMYIAESSSGEGDKKVVNGFYVIRYGESHDNEFIMKNVRHILVKFVKLDAEGKPVTSTGSSNSNTNVTYTEAEKKYAKDEADKLLKQWLEGEATEDTFAELATKETDDTGSQKTGGLYENIIPGQMVESFNDWCFDETRKTGDYEIIETEYGYHIMYFVSNSELTYRQYMIHETMRSEDTTEWYTALVEGISFTSLTEKYIDKEITIA